jgi:hypothetical protein
MLNGEVKVYMQVDHPHIARLIQGQIHTRSECEKLSS